MVTVLIGSKDHFHTITEWASPITDVTADQFECLLGLLTNCYSIVWQRSTLSLGFGAINNLCTIKGVNSRFPVIE